MPSAARLLISASSTVLLLLRCSSGADVEELCKSAEKLQEPEEQMQSPALLQKVLKRDEKISLYATQTPCSGVMAQGSCWYLSETAETCIATCKKYDKMFSFVLADSDNTIVPELIGHTPAVKQEPWASLECYVAAEDRYHPATAAIATQNSGDIGAWSHEGCRLACPCADPATGAQIDAMSELREDDDDADDDGSLCTWESNEKCQKSFLYKGIQFNGCSDLDHPTPWCSHDPIHEGTWSTCIRTCTTTFTTTQLPTELITKTFFQSAPELGGWVNQISDYLKVVEADKGFGGKNVEHSNEEDDAEECTRTLLRFAAINDVNAVKPIAQGRDPFFPAAASSIAPAGANCGDKAHSIHDSCSKYNHWESMDSISQQRKMSFAVFDPKDGVPVHTDVQQGGLGTCYFLSAIASIAYRTPEVIEHMFVRREHWASGIISTEWAINGMTSIIEVDKTVPSRNGRPFFTTVAKESGAWWPAILEKSWSKIYSSYKAAEAGYWAVAASAITRAPTVTYYHSQVKGDDLWQVLLKASENKWPMGASTTKSYFGLAAGHAYSVLEAWQDKSQGKLVKVRNPWHTNYYKGSQPNPGYGHDSGIFTMSFNEFETAFVANSVAKVASHYEVTASKVEQKNGVIQGSFTFGIQSSKWFAVSVVWPNHRMLCKTAHPSYVLAVQKQGANKIFTPEPTAYASNAVYIEIPAGSEGGPGTYNVVLSTDFPDNTFIHEVYLNVYAEHSAISSEIVPVQLVDYPTSVLAMVGPVWQSGAYPGTPCDVVMIDGKGMWTVNKARLVHGVPTYDSWDGTHLAYYVSERDEWFLTNSKSWAAISRGEQWSFGKLSKDNFMCGCKDSAIGVGGVSELGCDRVKAPNVKFRNVQCDANVAYASLAQAYCPVTCDVSICREPL